MKELYEKGAGDMHLDYPMTKSGLFILKREDFDDISKEILTEYEPNALKSPQPLDVEHLIEECLFLDMKSERLSDDGKVLGLIAFADTVYTGIGSNDEPFSIEVQEGTVLLDKSLDDLKHPGRKRFTQAHEASHWICHRSHHSYDKRRYEFCKREECPAIACRSEGLEHPGRNAYGKWTDEEWEEWQANNLAAALLMPKEMFLLAFYDTLRKYGIKTDYLCWDNSVLVMNIVDEIKYIFNVSRRAVELRMIRLGVLLEGRS